MYVNVKACSRSVRITESIAESIAHSLRDIREEEGRGEGGITTHTKRSDSMMIIIRDHLYVCQLILA